MHSVLIPLTAIFSTVSVIECPETMAILSELVAFILSLLEMLSHIFRVDLFMCFFHLIEPAIFFAEEKVTVVLMAMEMFLF